MNVASPILASLSPAATAGGTTANPSPEPGAFGALVVSGATAAGAQSPVLLSEPTVLDAVVPLSGEFAAVSAATLAMLSTLDRSATMLSQPLGVKQLADAASDEDDQLPATDSVFSDSMPPTLISTFVAVNLAPPPLATTSQPGSMAASPNTIAPEVRSAPGGKAELPSKTSEAAPETAKDLTDIKGFIAPTSAMIRDLASLMASSVTAPASSDVVAVDRHLDLARGDAWLNDLARDIADTAASGGRLKFGLAPESLGRLDVEIRQGQAGVSVHMTTRTDTARDLLTAAQPRIVDEIRAQGVRVAGTEVSTDASGFGGDRAGSTPRQPLALAIEAALSTAAPTAFKPTEAVASGRYA